MIGRLWTPEELEAAFPLSDPPAPSRPNGDGSQGAAIGGAGDIDESALPNDLMGLIRDGVPQSRDRSRMFMAVVAALKTLGYTSEGVYLLLARYPGGIAQKYLTPRDRLQREIERAYAKVAAPASAMLGAPAPVPPAPPVFTPAAPALGAPTLLAQTVAVYRKWLALEDDWPVYVTLGAIAANLLEGEPVWLGLIGPSSSAKTELLKSVSYLPYAHVVETFSPAGLLSGSYKKSRIFGATGGVLKKLGRFGVLLFMDFGSVLSLRQDPQAEMVAALRRVYDGRYSRQLGSDGGITLDWEGKAGCIFGATQKYDSHHVVIGTLGDRFLLTRISAMPDEQMEKCQLQLGERTAAAQELAQAARDLIGALPNPPPAPERMSKAEYSALKQAVRLAIRLRAGVVRDSYRRDIDDVHEPEGPARFILVLQQLFAGLVFIGVPRDEAHKIIRQVAFDSAPRQRLRAFNALTDDLRSTSEITAETGLTFTPTRRALEDLAAQGLALREEEERRLPRGQSGSVVNLVECWKRTSMAAALCHPRS
jgi:hypothetical protein